jgi:hypothetical protein
MSVNYLRRVHSGMLTCSSMGSIRIGVQQDGGKLAGRLDKLMRPPHSVESRTVLGKLGYLILENYLINIFQKSYIILFENRPVVKLTITRRIMGV